MAAVDSSDYGFYERFLQMNKKKEKDKVEELVRELSTAKSDEVELFLKMNQQMNLKS